MRERTLVGKVPVDIPEVIPPRSLVILRAADEKTPDWKKDVGRKFRVGYYNRRDGLDCVWLVNEKGEYEQTTDRLSLLRYFSIEKLSRERDYYGESRPTLRPLRPARQKA
ncbi:MAG TPA: hypothetical protein VHD56_07405 [Tepidisphaeraceae bacterium]|nr:hypothetical protein [Tepidisphaeraceae bacterium]